MARRAARTYQVGRVRLVVLQGKRKLPRSLRVKTFIHVHQKAIGVVIVVIAAVVLVVVKQHQLAALTFASVVEKAVELLGEIFTDRLFPGGEFTKEV